MKKIAITGGIGSGKSLALEIIKSQGYKTLSCDEIVADIYEKKLLDDKIYQKFPTAFENGKLNKKLLADIVFRNGEKVKLLNSIVHPKVMEIIEGQANACGENIFVEVPLLFESGLENKFNEVIVIIRNQEDRVISSSKKYNLNKEDIVKRLKNQVDYNKLDLSGYNIIYNNKDEDSFKQDILKVINALCEKN